MKINSTGGPQTGIENPAIKPQDKTDSTEFKTVFDQTVKTAQPVYQTVSPTPVQPAMPPTMGIYSPAHLASERVLDAMERYQQVLGDAQANLRDVSPTIDKMKQEIKETEQLMNEMPEGHPLKQIIDETLIVASKEVVRFESGDYVD